jgi:O-antigen/teichoic acid export membrane protein
VYAAASRFITTGTLFTSAARIAIAPRLSRLMAENRREEASALYHGATQATVLAAWPLYIGLAAFAPAVLAVFGHGFHSGATAMTILAIAMLVDMFTGNIQTVLLMVGGTSRWNMFNAILALTIDVAIDLWLVPKHGSAGAATGWAVAIIVVNIAAALEVRYVLDLPVTNRSTMVAAGATLACFAGPALVVMPAIGRGVTGLAVWLVVSLAAFAGFILWSWRSGDRFNLGPSLASILPPSIAGSIQRRSS